MFLSNRNNLERENIGSHKNVKNHKEGVSIELQGIFQSPIKISLSKVHIQ